jgi:hypothetical protein
MKVDPRQFRVEWKKVMRKKLWDSEDSHIAYMYAQNQSGGLVSSFSVELLRRILDKRTRENIINGIALGYPPKDWKQDKKQHGWTTKTGRKLITYTEIKKWGREHDVLPRSFKTVQIDKTVNCGIGISRR